MYIYDRTAVLIVVPGQVYSHGAECSQRIVEDSIAVLVDSPKAVIVTHRADSQRIAEL